ncbi:CHD5-like protein-domain-containing protein [Pisolithus orientalis]|uniref:CHD5-like protein-domain-containing protein n=1 Tax=Pisolithus orientalis TaxID=936130 RepID=UPI0022246DEB|nr:CHD5-like protein-domain-containing protein [Pisolithus orientalis]KAI6032991.1 CHD5-like protein-domain-containing protein [Pisolithus orientalis]
MSLILTIFALVFFTELVSWIGHSVLLDLAWGICCRMLYSASIIRQRELKTEVLATKKELLQTSAQDQFAKWAKLRRSIDKGLAELEKLNSELASQKTAFSVKFNSLVWILTTGLQFAVGWWYRRSAVFYLPPGWFGPLTWWLALPFAPKGSVSVGVWQLACRRAIKVGERTVKTFITVPGATGVKGGTDGTSTSDIGKAS